MTVVLVTVVGDDEVEALPLAGFTVPVDADVGAALALLPISSKSKMLPFAKVEDVLSLDFEVVRRVYEVEAFAF